MIGSSSFLGFPDRLADGSAPKVVIVGAGHGSTYPHISPRSQRRGWWSI